MKPKPVFLWRPGGWRRATTSTEADLQIIVMSGGSGDSIRIYQNRIHTSNVVHEADLSNQVQILKYMYKEKRSRCFKPIASASTSALHRLQHCGVTETKFSKCRERIAESSQLGAYW